MKKRALLIGINNYLKYQERSLQGCVRDITILKSVLKERFGFGDDDIICLKNEEATRDAIIKELKNILQACETNDVIVFHFSGHGTRRKSNEPHKIDGLEEAIMPYDSGTYPDVSEGDIRDSDLRNWVALLTEKTSNINLFFDSCYSGSIMREGKKIRGGSKVRGIDTDSREISLPSVEISGQQLDSESIFPSSSANWLSLSESYSLLTACHKDEFAKEYMKIKNGRIKYYGAFTYFLVDELSKAPLNCTYQDVFEQVCVKMQANSLRQNPQLEGNKARELFSDAETNSMKYVSVKKRSKNKVTLSAGAIHGLAINSEWTIYPPGTKQSFPENKLGTVKIIDVDVITSAAKIMEEDKNNKISAGCRAVEDARHRWNRKATVYIDSPSIKLNRIKTILVEDIEKSFWLRVINTKTEADFVVSLSVLGKEIRIQILKAADEMVMFQTTIQTDVDLLRIRENLEKLSRYSMILELDNPSSKLKNLIDFTLLQKIDGKWEGAKPVYNNLPKYVEDEQIAFRVINNSMTTIYVSILDLDIAKKIELLYPPKAASERLSSTLSPKRNNSNPGILRVGEASNERIKLFIPQTAFLSEFPEINKKGGIEIFKLMVTTEQTDFSWLEQRGMINERNFKPSIEDSSSKFSSLKKSREAVINLKDWRTKDWLTINRSFYLCKR